MNEVIVRKATVNDLEILRQFEQGVVKTERPFDITLASGLIHYYDLEELLNSPHAELVVAELDKKIIGSGYARIEKSKEYLAHRHHVYFGFMYVLPEHRGQGVNKKIIDFLKGWAKNKNIDELRLEVYSQNTAAIRAYEKLGFSQHMIEMRMKLD
ncbi:MAG: GNAT family N-acetyltransferase [Bacteroidetes bacterium]|nr:GNAT family N-acetyltransferase [Bacteroidota bacterium]MBI3483027.1 GNAT family N-acetyltransferase [Bacteroidota bacterium]